MFTLIGRTFVAYEDKHLGLSTVALLTQSQGNTNEDEWFSLLVDLIENNSKVHVASFRGMIVNLSDAREIIFQENISSNDASSVFKKYVLKSIATFEKDMLSKQP